MRDSLLILSCSLLYKLFSLFVAYPHRISPMYSYTHCSETQTLHQQTKLIFTLVHHDHDHNHHHHHSHTKLHPHPQPSSPSPLNTSTPSPASFHPAQSSSSHPLPPHQMRPLGPCPLPLPHASFPPLSARVSITCKMPRVAKSQVRGSDTACA